MTVRPTSESASSIPTLSLSALFAALPDFALAGTFLITWIRPETFGVELVGRLVTLLLLEFITIHSAAFMGMAMMSRRASRTKRVGGILFLTAFYSLFAGAFSFFARSWWPILSFWGLVGNRLLQVLIGRVPEGREQDAVIAGWGITGALYVICVFIVTIAPIPSLGVSPSVVAAQHFSATGIWIEQPWRPLAGGFLYYLLVGWSELKMQRFNAA
ncbi:MAG: hypothetical protein WBX15_00265 [Thermoanaerobaculia bacterium]